MERQTRAGRRVLRLVWARDTYSSALIINLVAFFLPALYNSLSKLWMAKIDPSMVVTIDVYIYISTLAEILNEGLPRASWSIIGNTSKRSSTERLAITKTLLLTQALLGLVVSLTLLIGAPSFARFFVPSEVRSRSIIFVQISSFSALGSAVEAAVAAGTRALDQPDVPLILSCVRFVVNIVLDLLFLSSWRVSRWEPTINMHAGIQLACNLTSALAGITYFLLRNRGNGGRSGARPSWSALRLLMRPGIFTLVESAVRNALYLWIVSNIVSLGVTYATAWGVFNSIRWGLLMVPVSALEATTLTFVGHEWGRWRHEMASMGRPYASYTALLRISRPARVSTVLALVFEVPVSIFMSMAGIRYFARHLSGSDAVAKVAERMWRTIDWCYIMYAVSTQLVAILLATRPKWYLWQSLTSNLLYVLPWAIFCQVKRLNEDDAWTYHALIFGGSLVFSFVCTPIVLAIWVWVLRTGRAHLEAHP
ncbi:hypothetical protein CDD80_4819 [Ophiocordyceps camponoti-rufipedis]|uniref:Polysaccharide biosynthesis protein C-terminal domain-containing protein n=1 Tax=Ophiocordyceps camponoti-rufipedis TaxID=2004952 RepID=A0A2C5YXG7_9HYPO|nr:hypothetical protein CDD80_4819 [Ophiocordyceps camponoti-rufipedis]